MQGIHKLNKVDQFIFTIVSGRSDMLEAPPTQVRCSSSLVLTRNSLFHGRTGVPEVQQQRTHLSYA